MVPNCRRLKPTLLGVLNKCRKVSAKLVMRVSARDVKANADDTFAAYATVAPAAAGRMRAISGSEALAHVVSGAVKAGSPARAVLTPTHALLP